MHNVLVATSTPEKHTVVKMLAIYFYNPYLWKSLCIFLLSIRDTPFLRC